jgi:hypothetical protein
MPEHKEQEATITHFVPATLRRLNQSFHLAHGKGSLSRWISTRQKQESEFHADSFPSALETERIVRGRFFPSRSPGRWFLGFTCSPGLSMADGMPRRKRQLAIEELRTAVRKFKPRFQRKSSIHKESSRGPSPGGSHC